MKHPEASAAYGARRDNATCPWHLVEADVLYLVETGRESLPEGLDRFMENLLHDPMACCKMHTRAASARRADGDHTLYSRQWLPRPVPALSHEMLQFTFGGKEA